jgi:hypothetical protein
VEKVENIQFRKMSIFVLQVPHYKTYIKRGTAADKPKFVSLAFGLPLMGALQSDHQINLWWPDCMLSIRNLIVSVEELRVPVPKLVHLHRDTVVRGLLVIL